MLAPSVNVVNTLLTSAYNETLLLDAYSQTTNNLMIGKLPDDPDWLVSVRSRVAMLSTAGAQWISDKPGIWGPVLLQFTNYASAFSGVAAQAAAQKSLDDVAWKSLLSEVLVPPLNQAITATTSASTALQQHLQAFQDIEPLLEDSINQGWAALAGEEQQMMAIAAQLQQLQDQVASLQQQVSSAEISGGQSVITTLVKTLYNVATETAESFSFMSMVTAAYTVGKTYYDIVTDTDAIADTLVKIGQLQTQASAEAQAAAGTKMVLQLLYNLEGSLTRISNVLPQITSLWQTELQKVQQAIDAVDAGVNPATYLDLFTVPTAANAGWQAIDRFAVAIPQLKTEAGPPVTLDPQAPLGQSTAAPATPAA